jgi:hypothetical protein
LSGLWVNWTFSSSRSRGMAGGNRQIPARWRGNRPVSDGMTIVLQQGTRGRRRVYISTRREQPGFKSHGDGRVRVVRSRRLESCSGWKSINTWMTTCGCTVPSCTSSTSRWLRPTRHSLKSARDEDSWLCLSMELCLDRCLSWSREDPFEFSMLSSVVLGCTGKSMTSGQAPYVSAVWQSRRVVGSSGMKCALFYASGI